MAKQPKNSGRKWTKQDKNTLKKRANGNTPTPLIAYELGRSVSSIYQKANELKISLQPPNKSPYTRRKK